MEPLVSGFKYLGYLLKPLGYRVCDWNWLVQKFEKRICHWTHKLLSLGDRLILVQAVLSSILVYCLGLVPIPLSILHKLRSIMFAFVWGSTGNNRKYHLINWQSLSWPKENEGWGFKNIYYFSTALRLKNLWMVLMNNSIWHRVLTSKYLKGLSVVDWLRRKTFGTRRVFVIWKGFLQTLPWMGCQVAWQVGNGSDVLIGIDPVIGVHTSSSLLDGLRSYLEDLNITTLSQAHNTLPDSQSYWYTADELCINGAWKDACDKYTRGQELCGIRLSSQSYTLLWAFNKHDDSISAKLVYECIVNSRLPPPGSRIHTFLWSGSIPKKIGCFIWLILRNRILTWDNLQKRGWHGPGICPLCNLNEEIVLHIFSHCSFWKNVLSQICDQLHISLPPRADTLGLYIEQWISRYSRHSMHWTIPIFTMWSIWKAWNLIIFEEKKLSILIILHQINSFIHLCSPLAVTCKKIRVIGPSPCLVFPCGFFDGASTNNLGGVGFCLYLNVSHHFEFVLGLEIVPTLKPNFSVCGLFYIPPI